MAKIWFTCPQCGLQLDFPDQNPRLCPRCGQQMQLGRFVVPPRPTAPLPPPTPYGAFPPVNGPQLPMSGPLPLPSDPVGTPPSIRSADTTSRPAGFTTASARPCSTIRSAGSATATTAWTNPPSRLAAPAASKTERPSSTISSALRSIAACCQNRRWRWRCVPAGSHLCWRGQRDWAGD